MRITKTKVFENIVYSLANLVGQLRQRLLGKHAIGVVYDSENGIIMSGVSDVYVGGNLGFRGKYESPMVESLLARTTAESRVLILGTHVGSVLIPLARKVREVVAYEANPKTYQLLRMNLLLNGIENCQTNNLAVSDQAGTLEFLTQEINSGGSKRGSSNTREIHKLDKTKIIQVPSVPLDEHVTDPAFDLILADIEGSEYFAFRGMQKLLAASAALQFEFLPNGLRQIAHASVEEFAGLLAPHFSKYQIQGTDRVATRSELHSFLQEIYDSGFGVDILATK